MHQLFQHRQTNTGHAISYGSNSALISSQDSRLLFKSSEIESIKLFSDKQQVDCITGNPRHAEQPSGIDVQILTSHTVKAQKVSDSQISIDKTNSLYSKIQSPVNISNQNKLNLFPKQEKQALLNMKQKQSMISVSKAEADQQSCGDQIIASQGILNSYQTQFNHKSKFFQLEAQLFSSMTVNVSTSRTKKSRSSLITSTYQSSNIKIPTIQEWFSSLSKTDKVLAMTLVDETLISSLIRMQQKIMKKGPGKFQLKHQLRKIPITLANNKVEEIACVTQDYKFTSLKALTRDDKTKIETQKFHENEFIEHVRLTTTVFEGQENQVITQESLNTLTVCEQLVLDPVKFYQLVSSIVGQTFLKVPLDIEWDSQRGFFITKTPAWFIPSVNNSLASYIIFYLEISLWMHYEAYVRGKFRAKTQESLDTNFFISKENQFINLKGELQEIWTKIVDKSNLQPSLMNELGAEISKRANFIQVNKEANQTSNKSDMQINQLNGGLIQVFTSQPSNSDRLYLSDSQFIKALQQNKDPLTFFDELCLVQLSKIGSLNFQHEALLVQILRERKLQSIQSSKLAKQKQNKKKKQKLKKQATLQTNNSQITPSDNSQEEFKLVFDNSKTQNQDFNADTSMIDNSNITQNNNTQDLKSIIIDTIEEIYSEEEEKYSDDSIDFQSNQDIIKSQNFSLSRPAEQSKIDLISELLEDNQTEIQESKIQSKIVLSQVSFGAVNDNKASLETNHHIENQISFSEMQLKPQMNPASNEQDVIKTDDMFFNYETLTENQQNSEIQQENILQLPSSNQKKKKQSKCDVSISQKKKDDIQQNDQKSEEEDIPTFEIIRSNKNFKQALQNTSSAGSGTQASNSSLNKKKKKKRSKAVVPSSSDQFQDKSQLLNAFMRNIVQVKDDQDTALPKNASFIEEQDEIEQNNQLGQDPIRKEKNDYGATIKKPYYNDNYSKSQSKYLSSSSHQNQKLIPQKSTSLNTPQYENKYSQSSTLIPKEETSQQICLDIVVQTPDVQAKPMYIRKQNRFNQQYSSNFQRQESDASQTQSKANNGEIKASVDLIQGQIKKHAKTRQSSPQKNIDSQQITPNKFSKPNQFNDSNAGSRTITTQSVEPNKPTIEQPTTQDGEQLIKVNNPTAKKKNKSKNKKKNLKSQKTSGLVTPSEYPQYDQSHMNNYYGMGMYPNPNMMMPQYNMNFNAFQSQSPNPYQQPYIMPSAYQTQMPGTISPVYQPPNNYNDIFKSISDPRSFHYLQQLVNQVIQSNNLSYSQPVAQQFIFNPQDIPKDPYNTFPVQNNRADFQNKLIEEFYEIMEDQMSDLIVSIDHKLDSVKSERDQAIIMVESIIRQTFNQSHQNNRPPLDIRMYGSMASKLAIEQSDVDLAVVGLDFQGSREIQIKEMGVLYEQLKQMLLTYSQVLFIDTATVPVIKLTFDLQKIRDNFIKKQIMGQDNFQCDQNVEEEMRYLGIDITFEDAFSFMIPSNEAHRANLGIQCISFIQQLCEQQIDLKNIVIFLKKLLQFNDLNQPYHGGLNSYSLVLITSAFLKKFSQVQSVSKNLVELLRYFGYFFDPEYIIVENQDFIQQATPMLDPMTVIDPLNKLNNTTRSAFRIKEIQEVFKRAYSLINQKMFEFSQLGMQKLQILSSQSFNQLSYADNNALNEQFKTILLEVLQNESQITSIQSFK